MLDHTSPLPHRPQRILVAGVTGVGKTTLARRLADRWQVPHVEMDRLHWGPGWVTRASFPGDLEKLASQDRWVTEWQYAGFGTTELLGPRADLCVWLNFPRRIARPRLIRRTITRNLVGRAPFPGCVEPPVWTAFTDPDHILRWEAQTHDKWRHRMPAIQRQFPELPVVELRTPRLVRQWLAGPAAA